ncbi:MAG: PQQ-binding-like beta-propeller repeat protein [Synergistaceae bacterium]|nr:PQQ-binding-like beta-propeller repeat protein [Synergistaceae bacterium]
MFVRKFLALIILILLFAVRADAWRGEVAWNFKAESGISSGVAFSENLILAGDENGKLYAVYRASGNLAWSYLGTNSVVGTPLIIQDDKDDASGKVIFNQADGTITCLNLDDGSVNWQNAPDVSGGGEALSDGAAFGNNKIYVCKGDNKLQAYDLHDGSAEWSYSSEQGLSAAPACKDNFIFLGELSGKFSIIDNIFGKRIGGGGAGGAVNTPKVYANKIYFSSWDGSVHCVDIKDIKNIKTLWTVNIGDPVSTSPEIKLNKIFVGTARGKIAALNLKDGKILWQLDTQAGAFTGKLASSSADNLVFAGGSDGVLYIIDAETGKLNATFKTDKSIIGDIAFSSGVLYFGSSDGNLYAIF